MFFLTEELFRIFQLSVHIRLLASSVIGPIRSSLQSDHQQHHSEDMCGPQSSTRAWVIVPSITYRTRKKAQVTGSMTPESYRDQQRRGTGRQTQSLSAGTSAVMVAYACARKP